MQDGLVFIITDGLERFSGVFSELAKISRYETHSMSFADFTKDDSARKLGEYGAVNSVIVVDEAFHVSAKQAFGAFLSSLFQEAFGGFLLVRGLTDAAVPQGEPSGLVEHRFALSEADQGMQAFYLDLHLKVLFDNATLADRLTRYIADSFKVVVYSELINKKNKEIEELNKELEIKNKTDNLTNLYSRAALFDILEQERKRTVRELWRLQRSRSPVKVKKVAARLLAYDHVPQGTIMDHLGVFTIMMIDIDNFKKINDTYGHLVGDNVLRTFGNLFLDGRILRENDIAGRFGGEEFIVILPETGVMNAVDPATRLAESFNQIAFSANDGAPFNVSISIGISEYHPQDKSCEDVVTRADKALYYAKEHGRNRIVVYEQTFGKCGD